MRNFGVWREISIALEGEVKGEVKGNDIKKEGKGVNLINLLKTWR